MKITIICPALPPKLDGIGDYTALLAAKLAETQLVQIITGQRDASPIAGVKIDQGFKEDDPNSYWGIYDLLQRDKPDWVLLQYNPFSYGKWGKNLVLPQVMRTVKSRLRGTKVALMIHEPYVPLITWQFVIMTIWQRWQLWTLGNCADVVFVSIQLWADCFRRWFRNVPVIHLPVGSNIPLAPSDNMAMRTQLGIAPSTLVLGFFGQAHRSRMFDTLKASADALMKEGQEILVLYIGNEADRINTTLSSVPFKATGRLDADNVSRHLAIIDIYFSAFIDGVSTRRGSLMAALQHGLAVVGTIGPLSDDLLINENEKSLILSSSRQPESIVASVVRLSSDPDLRSKLGHSAQALFEREFSWSHISNQIISTLSKLR